MKSVVYSLIALTIVATALASAPVFAQQSSSMTDEHITRIKANCQSALVTLGQIRTNEAPVFINRNQTYFSISDKLMARLNSRLTLNRYDATLLVRTASDYNTALAKFRTVYKEYDDTMAELIRIDCKRQPVGFYDKVAIVRQQRQKVHDAAEQLKNLIDQYRQGVSTFQTQHLSQLTGDSHE